MAELLVELFSEEIPARMQARAADDLKRLATDAFKAAGLEFSKAEAYVTPRRLALVVDGLPVAQADLKEERRGPRVDAPQNAIDGFLRASGLTLDQCEQRDTGKGVFYFAVVEKKGRATADVLAEALPKIFADLPWPKSMRWAHEPTRWVRPLHGIVALFDGKVVPVNFAGVASADESRGHRFLGPKPFKAKSFNEYRAKLREGYVLLDAAERRATIEADASAVAKDAGFALKKDEGLLDEVTGLVEWPVALMGRIDEQFMDVPAEVLTTSMRAHQKYFAVEKADGSLAPRFIVIANMLTQDGGQQVIAGNERVLRARLSDARFFWDQDRKHRLDSRVGALKDIVFHAKLGTVAEKVARVKKLAREIASLIGADAVQAERAAELCKADLTTGMVGEFPELQGVMGRYYARHDNERAEVAEAIAAHYSPKGPDDSSPTAPVSVALALADKIDTLVGFFAIDEKPTGSRDPFALRRAALGVIRLVLENKLRLSLGQLFEAAHKLHDKGAAPTAALLEFFADRLKVTLREQGVRHDLIDAVFSLGGEDDLVRLMERVKALTGFLATDDGANLLTAYKRASNIVGIEEKKDKTSFAGAVDANLLSLPQETKLMDALLMAHDGTQVALKKEDFVGAMAVLALLRGPVDAFFDKVKVNADEPAVRVNRLRLLSQIRATLGEVADFSKIEG